MIDYQDLKNAIGLPDFNLRVYAYTKLNINIVKDIDKKTALMQLIKSSPELTEEEKNRCYKTASLPVEVETEQSKVVPYTERKNYEKLSDEDKDLICQLYIDGNYRSVKAFYEANTFGCSYPNLNAAIKEYCRKLLIRISRACLDLKMSPSEFYNSHTKYRKCFDLQELVNMCADVNLRIKNIEAAKAADELARKNQAEKEEKLKLQNSADEFAKLVSEKVALILEPKIVEIVNNIIQPPKTELNNKPTPKFKVIKL